MHQVDAHITVYVGNAEAALRLEKLLSVNCLAGLDISSALFRHVDGFAKEGTLCGFYTEVSGVDVNWDEDGESIVCECGHKAIQHRFGYAYRGDEPNTCLICKECIGLREG